MNNQSFTALPIARAVSKTGVFRDEIVLYKLDKKKDSTFLISLLDVFKQTYNNPQSKFYKIATLGTQGISDFLKHTNENAVLAAKDNMPFGLLVFNAPNSSKHLKLDTIITWHPFNNRHVKDGGKMLMKSFFEEAKIRSVNAVNFHALSDSHYFYIDKLGLNIDERNICVVTRPEIEEKAQYLDKIIDYVKIDNTNELDLSKTLII